MWRVVFVFSPFGSKFLVQCSETEQMDLKTLVSMLQAFIEGSTLGEFHARLQALLVFHCHVLLMPQVAEKGKLPLHVLSLLYNNLTIGYPRLSKQITKLINTTQAYVAVFPVFMKNTVGQFTPSFGVAKLHDYKKNPGMHFFS